MTTYQYNGGTANVLLTKVTGVKSGGAAVASRSGSAWQVTLYGYHTTGQLTNHWTYTQNAAGTAVLTAVNAVEVDTLDLQGNRTVRRLTVGTSAWNQWYDYDGAGRLWKVFGASAATKPASADVTYTYRPSGVLQDRTFLGSTLVRFKYTIREQLEKIGDPALTTHPFSAKYTYHGNGTVSEAEFYSAGSPATSKRYRYVFASGAWDALNRQKSADYSSWSGSAWTTTLAHDLATIGYDKSGNLTTFQRYRETGTLIDNLSYTSTGGTNRLASLTEAAGTSAETWDAEAGSFTYDANGNVKTSPAPYSVTATTYDHRNLVRR